MPSFRPTTASPGARFTVGTDRHPRGRSDWLGPALVTDVPLRTRTILPVDVADLPVRYSLGAGAFELFAPYKAGYALQVGSGYSVSVFGSLLDADGAPLALLMGEAHPAGDPNRNVDVFTNASGRFAAEGLAPGRWNIEFITEAGPIRYELVVPDGTEGLHQAGELRPSRSIGEARS